MKAWRVILIFVVMGLLLGGAFGLAKVLEDRNNAPPAGPNATPAEVAADPLVREAQRAGIQDARPLANRMGVRVVCGRSNGRPAVYAAGRLYTPDGEEPDTFISQWEHWCSPAATEPVPAPSDGGRKL